MKDIIIGILIAVAVGLGVLLYLAPKEDVNTNTAERDSLMSIAVNSIYKADSLHVVALGLSKEVDSLKKISKQYDAKLISIKKYYEKKYTDVSNNTPTESYKLFTEYTSRRFPVSR